MGEIKIFNNSFKNLLLSLQSVYFKPRKLGSKGNSRSDAAGTTVLSKVPYCKTKMFSYFLCLLFMYYLGEKYYKPVIVQ